MSKLAALHKKYEFDTRLNQRRPDSAIEAIWNLLATGDRFYRAAGILLLQEYVKTLAANGKGEYASRLVQQFRDDDPYKKRRRKGMENKLVP